MGVTSPNGSEDRKGKGRFSLGTLSRSGIALLQAGFHLTLQTSVPQKGGRMSTPSCRVAGATSGTLPTKGPPFPVVVIHSVGHGARSLLHARQVL